MMSSSLFSDSAASGDEATAIAGKGRKKKGVGEWYICLVFSI